MPHWAELDDDQVVIRVLRTDETDYPTDAEALAFLDLAYGGTWQRTYYATEGHTYAGPGYRWNPSRGDFDPPPSAVDPDPLLSNDGLANQGLQPPGG